MPKRQRTRRRVISSSHCKLGEDGVITCDFGPSVSGKSNDDAGCYVNTTTGRWECPALPELDGQAVDNLHSVHTDPESGQSWAIVGREKVTVPAHPFSVGRTNKPSRRRRARMSRATSTRSRTRMNPVRPPQGMQGWPAANAGQSHASASGWPPPNMAPHAYMQPPGAPRMQNPMMPMQGTQHGWPAPTASLQGAGAGGWPQPNMGMYWPGGMGHPSTRKNNGPYGQHHAYTGEFATPSWQQIAAQRAGWEAQRTNTMQGRMDNGAMLRRAPNMGMLHKHRRMNQAAPHQMLRATPGAMPAPVPPLPPDHPYESCLEYPSGVLRYKDASHPSHGKHPEELGYIWLGFSQSPEGGTVGCFRTGDDADDFCFPVCDENAIPADQTYQRMPVGPGGGGTPGGGNGGGTPGDRPGDGNGGGIPGDRPGGGGGDRPSGEKPVCCVRILDTGAAMLDECDDPNLNGIPVQVIELKGDVALVYVESVGWRGDLPICADDRVIEFPEDPQIPERPGLTNCCYDPTRNVLVCDQGEYQVAVVAGTGQASDGTPVATIVLTDGTQMRVPLCETPPPPEREPEPCPPDCCVDLNTGNFVCPSDPSLNGQPAPVADFVQHNGYTFAMLMDGRAVPACHMPPPPPRECPTCPEGMLLNTQTGECVPMPECPPGPSCPPGMLYNFETGECVSMPEQGECPPVPECPPCPTPMPQRPCDERPGGGGWAPCPEERAEYPGCIEGTVAPATTQCWMPEHPVRSANPDHFGRQRKMHGQGRLANQHGHDHDHGACCTSCARGGPCESECAPARASNPRRDQIRSRARAYKRRGRSRLARR